MTEPNSRPMEVREAVAWAIRAADQTAPPGWQGWLQVADAALAALAPFVAAREAAAAEAMREACAAEMDCGCAARPDVLARLAEAGRKRASYLCPHGDVCCALASVDLRTTPLPVPDALARVRAEAIKEADNPDWDSTDAAHPAWWRGNDAGVEAVVKIVGGILDGDKPGTHGSKTLTALVQRLARVRAEAKRETVERAAREGEGDA
jgi:hypothetical protein